MGTREFALQLWVFMIISLACLCLTAYIPPDNYLLNCGSGESTTIDQRTFHGDNQGSWTLPDASISAKSTSNLTLSLGSYGALYQTAILFTSTNFYKFPINTPGRHFIRLYFYPFAYPGYDLFKARFSVSTQPFTLLSNFTPQKSSDSMFKEYSLNVTSKNLLLYFTPLENTIAFVNAIEVVSAPDGLMGCDAKILDPVKMYGSLTGTAFETIYRINVGGPKVTPASDELGRTWNLDKVYLVNENTAFPVNFSGPIKFLPGFATEETAPVPVYSTCRQIDTFNAQVSNANFNATWVFPVDENFTYFVRLHFCDIVSKSQGTLLFNVFIGSLSAAKDLRLDQLATAYYYDYVIGVSDGQGKIGISIGPSTTAGVEPDAILNGVEIMKMNNSQGSLDGLISMIPISQPGRKKINLVIILGPISGAVLLALILFVARITRKKQKRVILHPPVSRDGLRIPLLELERATDNFDENLKIGGGVFGSVYEGMIDGRKVAVKRAAEKTRPTLRQFLTEIELLSQLHHRNLVSLVGYCDEGNEMIIVYEFMEKGDLRGHLYGRGRPVDQPLCWEKRLEICVGAARGIEYLHNSRDKPVIHRDIKSANILLDKEHMPKVSDFGISKVPHGFDSQVSAPSTTVKGSEGYIDPEYHRTQQLTVKSDVFSFGVVLLEVLCGRPVLGEPLPGGKVYLVHWAKECWMNGKFEDIIDPHIEGNAKPECLMKFREIIEQCLAEHGDKRPEMKEVSWRLEYVLELQRQKGSDNPDDSIPRAIVIPPWLGNYSSSESGTASAEGPGRTGSSEEQVHSSVSESKILSLMLR